jgi:hypothetical protein
LRPKNQAPWQPASSVCFAMTVEVVVVHRHAPDVRVAGREELDGLAVVAVVGDVADDLAEMALVAEERQLDTEPPARVQQRDELLEDPVATRRRDVLEHDHRGDPVDGLARQGRAELDVGDVAGRCLFTRDFEHAWCHVNADDLTRVLAHRERHAADAAAEVERAVRREVGARHAPVGLDGFLDVDATPLVERVDVGGRHRLVAETLGGQHAVERMRVRDRVPVGIGVAHRS